MAIVKNNFRVSRSGEDTSPGTASSSTEDDDEALRTVSDEEQEEDSSGSDDWSDLDSGMESDELDLSELGDAMTELCQVGNQSCSIPLELYDLPDLGSVLSLDTWNETLTEEERFALSANLPDMDQETFALTLHELFSGKNFHFRSPLITLFERLKGGLCDPRMVLYRGGLNFFQRRRHYCHLRKYQNSMVGSLIQIRDAWKNCEGYGIQERLQLLNILRKQRALGYERDGHGESELESDDSVDRFQPKPIKTKRFKPSYDRIASEKVKFGKENKKGVLRVSAPIYPLTKTIGMQRSWDTTRESTEIRAGLKTGKKQELVRKYQRGMYEEEEVEPYYKVNGRSGDQAVTIASYDPHSFDPSKNTRYSVTNWAFPSVEGQNRLMPHKTRLEDAVSLDRSVKSNEWSVRSKKGKIEDEYNGVKTRVVYDPKVESYRSFLPMQMDHTAKMTQRKVGDKFSKYDGMGLEYSEETESDSSEQAENCGDWNSLAEIESRHYGVVKPIYDSTKASKHVNTGRKSKADILPYPIKGKNKGKTSDPSFLDDVKLIKKSQVPQLDEKMQSLLTNTFNGERKRKGLAVDLDHHMQPVNYLPNYGTSMLDEKEEKLDESEMMMKRSAYKTQVSDAQVSEPSLLARKSVSKKGKGKVDAIQLEEGDETFNAQSNQKQQPDDAIVTKKKGKKKADAAADFVTVVGPDQIIPEKSTADIEPEKPQKKEFTLITPTIHSGFSFSIIHLLSAVRKAMTTQTDEQKDLPSLTVLEIVNRVRSNPGDPCILETQEPLQDLVRGVLRILSSKTAPLAAKGWRPLVQYEKSNKSWSWIGPLTPSSSDNEEETSPDTWGMPYKVLVKLVDAFANWLKSGQETLRQIGSLPPPPASMLSNLDEKERFKDLRAQKSLNTISPSSDEIRAYFRREELLRYSVPDRAFSYTAADGRKSIVAPLRRGGGKPTSKARDHFMLKPDRPPHVTILCLVRDAAARLPGSIGTRADVCTLIRDSQYIVEDVTDAQVNQVVSGALDRLHYERDPCVQFDSERKLWVYLHKDREEEDFEDDGTSSTKKWKRQRKDVTENSDVGTVNDGDADGNVDLPAVKGEENSEIIYNNMRTDAENVNSSTTWEALQFNPLKENNMVCQENSTTEDFDDEAFSRGRPIGLPGASLL
ncbi:uncharacterized protein LOC109723690 isoform X2 [Ananas comosus]|nr:uncharacterized protein LOC109723690 isoform X2 [Ananas comosus]XP_020107741.1 uncharacterized protein LOC109723690 isoform X2 [Ananas comosus]